MKKNFLLLFTTFLLFTLTATGCSNKVSGNLGKDGIKLVGTWNGVGNALGRDASYNCDYLSFSIDKEGQFTLPKWRSLCKFIKVFFKYRK